MTVTTLWIVIGILLLILAAPFIVTFLVAVAWVIVVASLDRD